MLQHTKRSRQAGFSLIEMIIAITIMTIIAGAALPLASSMINSAATKATKAELEGLAEATTHYFSDTGALPGAIVDMLVDPSVAGWSGPYLGGITTDVISGSTSFEVDGWSRVYSVQVSGDVWTATSAGRDASLGTADDIDVVLNVSYIRRRVTLERLATINSAITRYNSAFAASDPLPVGWSGAFAKLTSRGFLPASSAYQLDGWGDSFVEDPSGATPVVRANSIHLPGF